MGLIFFAFLENFFVPILTSGGLAAVSSSAFAALYSAFGKYDVVHIHAEGPAFFAWLPKMFGKRVVVTVHQLRKRLLPCDMSFDTFFIDPYGDVMPCNGTKDKEVILYIYGCYMKERGKLLTNTVVTTVIQCTAGSHVLYGGSVCEG